MTGGSDEVAARPPELTPEDKQALLHLVRQTLTDYLSGTAELPEPPRGSPALLQHRATFVTLRRRDTGDLRGCRGECAARQPLVASVTHMAIASATDDPRFLPVTIDELPSLHIEISALTPMEPIHPDAVVVGRHGLMIFKGPRSGLLLPQVPLAYAWNREQYLDALCRKAGLPPGAWSDADVKLYAFEAEVWGEEEAEERRR